MGEGHVEVTDAGGLEAAINGRVRRARPPYERERGDGGGAVNEGEVEEVVDFHRRSRRFHPLSDFLRRC